MQFNNVLGEVLGFNALDESIFDSGSIVITSELSGLRINFRDKNNYIIYSFFSEAGDFPIRKLQFDFIKSTQNGSGCNECQFELLKSTYNYNFELDYGDIIEIFDDSDAEPIWSGYMTEIPEETDELPYKFRAVGFIRALENCYIDRTDIATPTNISSFIRDIVQNDITDQIKGGVYNAAKVETILRNFNVLKLARTNAKEIIKKLTGQAVTYEYGYDYLREFFFREKSDAVDPKLIFIPGFNCDKTEITRSDYSSIKNKMFLEKKAAGAGTSQSVEVNQINSQNIYGIRAETTQVPETTDDTDVENYGTGLMAIKAFPRYKGAVRKLKKDFYGTGINYLKDCDGFGRLFTQEKKLMDFFLTCETLTNWTTSDAVNFEIEQETNIIHENSGSIKTTANSGLSLNAYNQYEFQFPEDWAIVEKISFWIYATKAGTKLKVGFGDAAITENEFDITIYQANRWEKKEIDVRTLGLSFINYIGFTCIDDSETFIFYTDEFKKLYTSRKYFDLELMKITYYYEREHYIDLEFGSVDYPFSSLFAESLRNIENLKNSTKGV